MRQKPVVWFVDDLPSNLEAFRKNHEQTFKVETFGKISDVTERIRHNDYPDALLCDLFFFDTVEQAQGAEKKLVELSQVLKQAAVTAGVDVHTHAAGINLMRQVNHQFNGPPPFPMYAYSSKAPYLFGQQEWEDVYNLGGRVLLKGRVPPEVERSVILGDIAKSKSEQSQASKAQRNSLVPMWIFLSAMLACIFTIAVGRLIRGAW